MQKIGLKAVLEMSGFQSGMRAYLTGTKQMESQTEKLLHSIQPVGVALAGLGAAGMAFIRASALTAARTEELNLVLGVMAENAQAAALAEGDLARASKLTATSVEDAVKGIKAKGIETQVATTLTTQFIRYELDMAKATQLARVAQDAAVYGMQDSSVALDGLMHGILTYNPLVLRTYGLNVQAAQAFKDFATANDIAVEEMDNSQRAHAMLNAVIEEGAKIEGTYEAAMESSSKQLRSLTGREWKEFLQTMGEHYLPAMDAAVESAKNLLEAFNEMDPEQQKIIANMLGIGTAVATVGGSFILLAPRAIATMKAVGTLTGATIKGAGTMVTLGKDTYAALTLMKEGATAAELATLGLAGKAAVAIPVLLALAAAAMAAYKAYELHQEIQERAAETSDTWTKMLQEQASAGKSATEIAQEYTKAQKRVAEAHEGGGLIADIFINKEKVMNANAETLNKTLATQAKNYTDYAQAVASINSELEEGEIALTTLTEAQYKDTRAVEAAKTQRKEFYDYLAKAGPTEEQLKALAELEEKMAEEQADNAKRVLEMERDYNREMIDMNIDRARAIADIDRNLAAQREQAAAQLAQRISQIDAQAAQQEERQAAEHARRMEQIEERYQEQLRDIQKRYQTSMYEAIANRDATAALQAMRRRDEELEEAKRDRDEQESDASESYARQQAEQAANLEAQRQQAQQAYQQQLADLETSRQEQIDELDRSQQRQREDTERHNQWTIDEMKAAFRDEYIEAIEAYASEEALYAQHLENMRRIWESYGGMFGLAQSGSRGFIGGYAEGGSFVTGGPTTATFGEGGVPEMVTAIPLRGLYSDGGGGGGQASGTMRHEVSGAVDGIMSGFEGRLTGAVTEAVVRAFGEVLH